MLMYILHGCSVYSIILGHNIGIRFTPSVYKYILSLKCDLEDLRVEDVTVHRYVYDKIIAAFVL